jgi:restriction system protein
VSLGVEAHVTLTSVADVLKRVYQTVLKPLRQRHGARGMRGLKLSVLLVAVIMVIGFLTLPSPWNSWFLAGGIVILIFSPFLIFALLELFALFAPRRHQSWKLGVTPPGRNPPPRPIVEGPGEVRMRLNAMNDREFEHEVAAIFGRLGYRTEVTPKTGDLGADVLMWDRGGAKWVVQVKQYSHPVGRPTVQAMRGVKRDFGAEGAMVVALSHFTKGAVEYAESQGIRLVDGDELIRMHSLGRNLDDVIFCGI